MKQTYSLALFMIFVIGMLSYCNTTEVANTSERKTITKWQCPDKSGLKTPVRLDKIKNKTMCLSLDGRTCLTGKKAIRACKKAKYCKIFRQKIKPVDCDSSNINKNLCGKAAAPKSFIKMAKTIKRVFKGKKTTLKRVANRSVRKAVKSYRKLRRLIKSVGAKTRGGMRKISRLLRKHNVPKKHRNFIKNAVKSGKVNIKRNFRHVMRRIKKSLTKPVRKALKKYKKNPKWLKKIKKILKKPTKKGLRKIARIMRRNNVPKKQRLLIRRSIKSPRMLKRVMKNIKKAISKKGKKGKKSSRKNKNKKSKSTVPKWFRKIRKLIKKRPTRKSAKKIARILRKHKVPIKHRIFIKKAIKSGKISSPRILRHAMRRVRKSLPKRARLVLRKRAAKKNKKSSAIPKWFKKVRKMLKKSPKTQTKKGLRNIATILKKHNIPKRHRAFIKKAVRSGKVGSKRIFKKIMKGIKKILPKKVRSLIKRKQASKNKSPVPKWFSKVKRLLKKPKALTRQGLNKITAILKRNKVPAKHRKFIRKAAISGKLATKRVLRHAMRRVRKSLPKRARLVLRKRAVKKSNKNKKSVIPKWLKKVKKLLKKKPSKKALKKIAKILKKHKVPSKDRVFIKKAVRSRRASSPKLFRKIMNKIKKSLPKKVRLALKKKSSKKASRKNKKSSKKAARKGKKALRKSNKPSKKALRKSNKPSKKALRKSNKPSKKALRKSKKSSKKSPSWFKSVKSLLRTSYAKTKKGKKQIVKILKTHNIPKKTIKLIKRSIRRGKINSPQVFRKIVKKIRKTIKRINKIPKWYRKVKKILKGPFAKTSIGLKRVKKILKKHNVPKVTRIYIKKAVKSGKIQSPKIFKKVLRKVQKVLPKKAKIALRVTKANKRPSPKWIKKVKKILRSPKAQSRASIIKINRILNKNKVSSKTRKIIKKAARRGKAISKKSLNKLIKKIKKTVKAARAKRTGTEATTGNGRNWVLRWNFE